MPAGRLLASALQRQAERLREAGEASVDVQLLGQLTSAEEWPKLLAYWERQNPLAISSWPRHLKLGAWALNLWPLPAGRIGLTAGLGGDVRKRQPKKPLSIPGLTVFNPETSRSHPHTALAVVCASWLDDVGITEFKALRVAPLVLEAWAKGGRLLSREIVTFGLDWPLPAPNGIDLSASDDSLTGSRP